MSKTPERRQSRRIEIRIPVSYWTGEGARKPGSTANVSRAGMLIVAHDSAPAGTGLRVAVTGADGREREIAGEIVRAGADGRLGVAISSDETGVLQSIIDANENVPIE